MSYLEMYKMIIKELTKIKDKDNRFDNLFLLICLLIFYGSNNGKYLDNFLCMLNEFDYHRNFRKDESEE